MTRCLSSQGYGPDLSISRSWFDSKTSMSESARWYLTESVMYPRSVTIESLQLAVRTQNPTGSIASWETVNGSMSKSPIENLRPASKEAKSSGSVLFHVSTLRVGWVAYTLIPVLRARTSRPWTWSECSCEITTASSDWMASPIDSRRTWICRQLKPASNRTRTRSVATNVAFPPEPLPSTQTRSFYGSPSSLPGAFGPRQGRVALVRLRSR